MKILLINPFGWQKDSINLGISTLAGVLKENQFDVKIIDLTNNPSPIDKTVDKIIDYAPQIIGFSSKTSTVKECYKLANEIRKSYQAIHVLGGPHATLFPSEAFDENHDIDYVFTGEAEWTLLEFCNRIKNNQPVNDVIGLVYKQDNQVVLKKRELIKNLEEIPYPNLDVIENFSWNNFRYPILTSRGCPYDCIYCSVPVINGKKFRTRSPKHVVDELEFVKNKYNITNFEILDDTFTQNKRRAKDICHELINRNINLSWYCHNGIRADKVDDELAELMFKAGCFSVALGIESGDETVFNSIKKGETLEEVTKGVKTLQKAGIKTVGYFILGLPDETPESFEKTLEYQQSLNLDGFTFGVLSPYKGTEVYDILEERGVEIDDLRDTSHFSDDEVSIPFTHPNFSKDLMIKAYIKSMNFDLYKDLSKRKKNKILIIGLNDDPITIYKKLLPILEESKTDLLFINNVIENKDKLKSDLKINNIFEIKITSLKEYLNIFLHLLKNKYQLCLLDPKLGLGIITLTKFTPHLYFNKKIFLYHLNTSSQNTTPFYFNLSVFKNIIYIILSFDIYSIYLKNIKRLTYLYIFLRFKFLNKKDILLPNKFMGK